MTLFGMKMTPISSGSLCFCGSRRSWYDFHDWKYEGSPQSLELDIRSLRVQSRHLWITHNPRTGVDSRNAGLAFSQVTTVPSRPLRRRITDSIGGMKEER